MDRGEGIEDWTSGDTRGGGRAGPGDHGARRVYPALVAAQFVLGRGAVRRHVLAQNEDKGELRRLHTDGYPKPTRGKCYCNSCTNF